MVECQFGGGEFGLFWIVCVMCCVGVWLDLCDGYVWLVWVFFWCVDVGFGEFC